MGINNVIYLGRHMYLTTSLVDLSSLHGLGGMGQLPRDIPGKFEVWKQYNNHWLFNDSNIDCIVDQLVPRAS